MGALNSTVWVKDQSEPTPQDVSFGPDDDEVPDWALDQMGDHVFVDGKRPQATKQPAKKAAAKRSK